MRRIPLVVVAVLMMSGAATSVSAADTTTTTSTSPTTTTTVVHRRIAALTGLPDPTAVTKRRSALTIKMDNTPQAHPQYGINEADVVYEEIVEGGITRLAAIFNSNLPTKVGPVRSVRRTDREIVFPIGGISPFPVVPSTPLAASRPRRSNSSINRTPVPRCFATPRAHRPITCSPTRCC